ncbi:hypothetical protein BU23DRAFT_558055 [Bimuria novae-zelandiae CBS 107.79]|uniref:Uncharacterized protein n=1 Tax=Bimuria novae-zelandiae CBS 107.79 TaxID=1447943 RepID=A0A6A5UV20_9PLEO|nr:hypothetical protein BU23DRAFT_558055 [Bimuria novae-zelandiae CBS 107.79]
MVATKSIILGCALALSTAALALPAPVPQDSEPDNCPYTVTAEDLTAIDSKTESCDSNAAFAKECADATRAAPAITTSFKKYDISEPGVQAALIAIMLYESGSFKFNHNHYPEPGRPGQGTRNMQMSPFNEKYATDLFGADAVAQAQGAGGDAALDAVLALVQGDEESFASAAWFLMTQCTADIKTGLASGSAEGWDAYLTKCVGTTHTEDRDPAWTAAKMVLGA